MSIKTARTVLQHEANAILHMAQRLDAKFTRAVNLILKARGPVIVIGMGKPALIAEKISASLASTGTSSFTMHPGDALHGDIGRVTRSSVVILLSNSGETEEIVKLLPFLKAIGVRIIAITGRVRSALAKASDVALDTSVVSEAEPLNVVPTASTTCMLAMGDAITMALVKKRKFKLQDFAMLHPGGSLGRRYRMTVKDVMRKGSRNPRVRQSASMKGVLIKITAARAGSATVVDERGRCVGIFTDGDLRRQFKRLTQNANKPVSEYMTRKPLTIREDMLAVKALEIFRRKHIDELPVVNAQGKVSGLLDVQDLLAQGFMLT